MSKWIPWRDLETPSCYHPVTIVTSNENHEVFLNGGTVISQQVLFGLDCGHAAPAKVPLQLKELRCAWHQKESPIVSVIVYEWHAHCQRCTYGRWAGLSKHNAMLFLSSHLHKNTDHVGYVEYCENPNAVHTLEVLIKNEVIPGLRAQS